MQPKRVLIVGGGSSGWMAAAYLDAVLNHGNRKKVDLSLVESPDVPRIGVGEATVPSINHILAAIGIDELEFMRRVDGTYKQSIKYRAWLQGGSDYYYHTFGRFRSSPVDTTSLDWLKSNRSIPFSETNSAQPVLCESCLAPRMIDPEKMGEPFPYAFHMNALKFADYLTEIATSRGVTRHVDHVVDVERTESGDIAAVKTKGGLRLEAELFIDCTGFAAILMEKTLGVAWIDCSQWLLCDRAITMHVPYEQHYPGYVRPYTTATALSSGWVWEIPLQTKRSLGYVHSSAFIDEEKAEQELRAFEGAHAESLDARTVHFKVGHRAKAWAGNCIAIGLAGSFIEPLESTGLYLSDLATVMLAEHFPYGDDMAPLAYRYNRIMANRFYEILDFINLHYCLTRRSDTEFWREIQKPERMHDRLRAKLDFWSKKPPSAADFEDQWFPGQPDTPLPSGDLPGDHRSPIETGGIFGLSSYEAIVYGMDYLHDECDQWFGADRPSSRVAPQIVNKLRAASQQLPAHDVWLKHVVGMADFENKSM